MTSPEPHSQGWAEPGPDQLLIPEPTLPSVPLTGKDMCGLSAHHHVVKGRTCLPNAGSKVTIQLGQNLDKTPQVQNLLDSSIELLALKVLQKPYSVGYLYPCPAPDI